MAEELKELIEKIQHEGVKVAEEKAAAIDAQAKRRAEETIKNAEREAGRIMAEAKAQIERLEQGAKDSVKQAARDTMLSLRKEIDSVLGRLVSAHVHQALTADELGRILATIVKGCGSVHKDEIIISVRREDLAHIEKALISELGQEVKKGITLKTSADIRGGFLISYDRGKSYFDFSDKSLAEYLASQLKTGLADIVKEAAIK